MDKATVLNRVYAADLPSRAKIIMFYLVNRSNKELTCFPAIPRIAKETGMSERTVQRALKELCGKGFVEKSSRYRENGGQSSNLYILLTKEEEKADDTALGADDANKGASEVENKLPEKINFRQEMRIIDFSFFDTPSLDHGCHWEGDNCVPP